MNRNLCDEEAHLIMFSLHFTYNSHITVLPSFSASGEVGPLIFVMKGTSLPFREILVEGQRYIKNITSQLPRNSLVSMRELKPGEDSDDFFQFADKFCDFVSHLTRNGRHILLTYNAYRCHMMLHVLRYFRK